jgi:hypothetical protein
MEIAVIACASAKRNMDVHAGHCAKLPNSLTIYEFATPAREEVFKQIRKKK